MRVLDDIWNASRDSRNPIACAEIMLIAKVVVKLSLGLNHLMWSTLIRYLTVLKSGSQDLKQNIEKVWSSLPSHLDSFGLIYAPPLNCFYSRRTIA